MRKILLIKLTLIFLILSTGIVIRSQTTAPTPTMLSAAGSLATVRAADGGSNTRNLTATDTCEEQLATANARLQKALDAYDHAIALAIAKDDVIAAKDALIALIKEGSAIKDQWIADLQADNKFLRDANKPTVKSRVRKFFETVEKILLVAGGIYLGRHI